jgi:hypothetical protein
MSWVQTASGRAVDLLAPRPEDIDFAADVAGPLARIARFGGHVPGGAYSVAQHCVIGARVIQSRGLDRDRELALHFLLHDAHEAYIGDLTRPLQEALSKTIEAETDRKAIELGLPVDTPTAGRNRELVVTLFGDAVRRLKSNLDDAIYAAAGIPGPTPHVRAVVKSIDGRMLETERRLFLGPCARPWAWDEYPPAQFQWPEKPRVWPWPEAADAWLNTLRDLCPAALKRKHAA